MQRKCCVCKKFMGIKKPLLDFSVSHGLCPKCYEREIKKITSKRKTETHLNVKQ